MARSPTLSSFKTLAVFVYRCTWVPKRGNSRSKPPVTCLPGALKVPEHDLVSRITVLVLLFSVHSCDRGQDMDLSIVLVHFPVVADRRSARKPKMKRRGSR